tara:strand:- start:370 stop:579 length:210 start_codon:yes stop_codon:yes gene_type:complete
VIGHVSPKTTYTHYRKAATTQQAEEYWEVRTTTKSFSKNDPPEEIKNCLSRFLFGFPDYSGDKSQHAHV